jgi:hypothetical protein
MSRVMNEARCMVSVRLPYVPDTNQMAPEGPALIIGPSGILQTRVLTVEELPLFADDDRGRHVRGRAGQRYVATRSTGGNELMPREWTDDDQLRFDIEFGGTLRTLAMLARGALLGLTDSLS